mgnify:CR=1 FL=1
MNENITKELSEVKVVILEHIAKRHENDSEWDIWDLLNEIADAGGLS